jgi:hypothetical protein
MRESDADNPGISDQLALISRFYSDVIIKYKFHIYKKAETEISYQNDCYEMRFCYDYKYGHMLFGGIGIFVKRDSKLYWLRDIVNTISKDKDFSFSGAVESNKSMTHLQSTRIVWDKYIERTFENCAPAWEAEVQEYIKRNYPVW